MNGQCAVQVQSVKACEFGTPVAALLTIVRVCIVREAISHNRA